MKNLIIDTFRSCGKWIGDCLMEIMLWIYSNLNNIDRAITRLGRNVVRAAVIGMVLNIIAVNFYPEFSERFPAIYGFYDGCLQFTNFVLTAVLKGINALFTRGIPEWWHDYYNSFLEIIEQLSNWIASLKY